MILFECAVLNVTVPHVHETFSFEWLTDGVGQSAAPSTDVLNVTVIVTLYATTNSGEIIATER
jgi:hypothetical protein